MNLEKDEALKYETALNGAINFIGNNEISDVLEELLSKIGEDIEQYDVEDFDD